MAAAAATGSRDYCVINANYRAVPCRRGTLSVGANRRVLCVPGLPYSGHRKSDMTRRKKRGRGGRGGRGGGGAGGTEIERGDGARTPVLWVSVHARKRHNGTLAICIHYRARARLLSASSREASPWGLRSRSSLCFASSPLPSFSPRSPSFLLSMVSAYVCTGLYFVLGVSHGS